MKTFDIYDILLSHPRIFNLIQFILIPKKYNQMYIDKYVKPKDGDKILDIGCGTADILEYLPNVEYLGFDMNQRYIQFASQRFGNRGKFFCKKVNLDVLDNKVLFDIIIAKNIVHHLDNNESNNLFELAYKVLKPDGRLITSDPCYVTNQSSIAKFILSLDRGKFIRPAQEYTNLALQVFSNVTISIVPDIGHISVTCIIMECGSSPILGIENLEKHRV